jgi:peroxiredoxin
LRGYVEAIREAGAELAVVGNGKPHQAEAFAKDYKLNFPLFADPELKAYAAAGLRRGRRYTLNPKSALHAMRAVAKGFMQGRTQGDPWQQGGAFVISPDGKTWFTKVNEEAGDHVDPEALVTACREASGR